MRQRNIGWRLDYVLGHARAVPWVRHNNLATRELKCDRTGGREFEARIVVWASWYRPPGRRAAWQLRCIFSDPRSPITILIPDPDLTRLDPARQVDTNY